VEELSLAQEIPHSPPLSLPQPLPRDTLPDRILLSSSNLKIRPSSDFRCPIKIPRHISPDVLFTLSWDFTLLSLSGPPSSSAAAATAASSDGSSSSAIDIGFCVLGKSTDGSFPLLTPYRSSFLLTPSLTSLLLLPQAHRSSGDQCRGISLLSPDCC
jgi:hypothetical protein